MRTRLLKKTRLFFAILFILATTAIFIDFRALIPERYFDTVLYLQFIPSVISFITLAGVASAGFLFVTLLTFLTGRTYCSAICPLGIMQDIISRIGGKVRRKYRRFGYGKPFTILRYSILAITLLFALAGGIYLVTLLDPYSIFGRTVTFFFKPLAIVVNNLVAGILSNYNIYTIYRVNITGFAILSYLIPLLFLLLITVMSFRKGRLYCNTVCPVGTALGLISKVSLFRIKIDPDCSRCGRCAVACKASCIDFLNRSVDLSRCVGCFNCIDICPEKAVFYGMIPLSGGTRAAVEKVPVKDKSKREFLTGSLMLLLFGGGRVLKSKSITDTATITTVREEKSFPVTPPGSISARHFLSRCTACALCVSACPKDVIQPSVREYGLTGIMQPHLDFHKGFCNFECTICSEVCPTGAIMPLDLEAKKLTQIGKVVFIKDNCVVHTDKTDCGACSEHCPTKAVEMVPYEGDLLIPEVMVDICIGCGACEYACPTIPYRAIYIDGNPIHVAADKPDTGKAVLERSAFPF